MLVNCSAISAKVFAAACFFSAASICGATSARDFTFSGLISVTRITW